MGRIQFRRGTTSSWASKNTILSPGEPGMDVTTGDYRLGDGVTPWTTLPSVVGAALKALLTSDGDILTRVGGVITRITRVGLVQDAGVTTELNTRYAPLPTAWVTATMMNLWVYWGAPQQIPQYRKEGDIVRLRGFIKGGSSGSIAFNLPAGFRPPADLEIAGVGPGVNSACGIVVRSGGDVAPFSSGATSDIAINVTFSTT